MPDPLKPGDIAPSFRIQPVFGLPLQVPGRRSLLLFLRPLSSPSTRSLLATLQASHRDFDRLQVVQFTRSSLEQCRDFVPRQHLLLPLVSDPEGQWYRAYGVGDGLARTFLNPRAFLQYSSRLSMGHGRPEGALGQQTAALLLDPEAKVLWSWYGRGIFDLPSKEQLSEAAGA